MSQKIRKILIATAVILVLGATAVAYYTISRRNASDEVRNGNKNNIPVTGIKKDAPIGELPMDFPEVLSPIGGEVGSSYSVTYPSSMQSTANFKSTKSVSAEYNSYMNYFTTNKYTILNKTSDKTFASIYVQNKDADINVVINQSTDSKTVDVTVSYLRR